MHQLIPRSKLSGDFPTQILQSHVFWMQLPSITEMASGNDHTFGRIDLRNRETPWQTKEGWFISHNYHAPLTQMMLGPDCALLDIRSPSATMITDLLSPLEFPEFIDVRYWKKKKTAVTVHLPRLKLDFQIDDQNRLECKQFLNMTINEVQRIGTFIGLENLLVVRQGKTRSVIVPYGTVSFRRQESHTKVQIDTIGQTRVRYHIYTVNSTLGTLVGNGSLTSHLYKIYLHAVTSHCHPDPLTCRTGTEEALAGLRAAATRSFQVVETGGVDAALFKMIAGLSPERVYYPVHLKRMQQVKWRVGLSPISQHDEFVRAVKRVADYAKEMNIFEDIDGLIEWRTAGDQLLAKRAAIRNAVFQTDEFGGSVVDKGDDEVYEARDMVNKSADEARVSYVARLIMSGQGRFNVHPGLLGVLEGLGDIRGPIPEVKQGLGYDQQWLDPALTEVWIPLYEALRGRSQDSEPFDWLFLLCTMTFRGKIELRLLETLLAFATDDAFNIIHPPRYDSFNLSHGYRPDLVTLVSVIRTCTISFGDSDESRLAGWPLETTEEANDRRLQRYTENLENQAIAFANELRANWPCLNPYINNEDDYPLYDTEKALEALDSWFESWSRNSMFKEYIEEVQEVLDRINSHNRPVFLPYQFQPGKFTQSTLRHTIRLTDLLMRPVPQLPSLPVSLQGNNTVGVFTTQPEEHDNALELLLKDFRGRRHNMVRKTYAEGLQKSIDAFREDIAPSITVHAAGLVERLKVRKTESKKYLDTIYRAIITQLGPQRLNLGPPNLNGSLMASKAGLWPRISPLVLLQQLATNRGVQLSHDWKAVLVTYGTAITIVQRNQRLFRLAPKAADSRVRPEFLKELENTGHSNWDPLAHPDWLLIEIENHFLIHPVQADIAISMITPPDNHNSIMQLCMGEGKTSVIVPIVAASLADKSKLVRVVVLKPLSGQMFQTLVQKLGGLVNRRVFFMPFSRGIAMGLEEIAVVKRLYQECINSSGILLVQPEHILSFKLLGLEWLYKSTHKQNSKTDPGGKNDAIVTNSKRDGDVARLLLGTQKWLELNSRDILDESDEILNVRHELIYTIGNPTPVENHPDRWIVIQEIFDLIQTHFKTTAVSVQDFELERQEQGRFGSIRILNIVAGKKLLRGITDKIIDGKDP